MKRILSFFVLAILCLSTTKSFAQISQTFEGITSLSSLSSNCWIFTDMSLSTTSKINGVNSLLIKPSSNNAKMATPFIDFQAGNVLSFVYMIDSKLSNKSTRSIILALQDKNGSISNLSTITISDANNSFGKQTLSYTLTATDAGIKRFVIIVNATGGDGNTTIYLDDINIASSSATTNPVFHYASNCNTAPVANNDLYNALSTTSTFSATGLLSNDNDANNEALTTVLGTNSVDGNVVVNADGSFTFTPNAGFAGSYTTFTYKTVDAGFESLSTTATVTISFPQGSVLPIQLLNFSGIASNNKINLSWNVAENETGNYFEVQKSNDGKTFESLVVLFNSTNQGTETYNYTDAASAQMNFYRLKIVNKNNTTSYSKIISFKTTAAANNKIVLLQNPVQSILKFSVAVAATETTEVTVLSLAGIKVSTQKIALQKGNNTISVALNNNLIGGIYILQTNNSQGTQSIKFIKQ